MRGQPRAFNRVTLGDVVNILQAIALLFLGICALWAALELTQRLAEYFAGRKR